MPNMYTKCVCVAVYIYIWSWILSLQLDRILHVCVNIRRQHANPSHVAPLQLIAGNPPPRGGSSFCRVLV